MTDKPKSNLQRAMDHPNWAKAKAYSLELAAGRTMESQTVSDFRFLRALVIAVNPMAMMLPTRCSYYFEGKSDKVPPRCALLWGHSGIHLTEEEVEGPEGESSAFEVKAAPVDGWGRFGDKPEPKPEPEPEPMGDCPECGNTGFSKPGTGYGDVCDFCGGSSASAGGMPIRVGGIARKYRSEPKPESEEPKPKPKPEPEPEPELEPRPLTAVKICGYPLEWDIFCQLPPKHSGEHSRIEPESEPEPERFMPAPLQARPPAEGCSETRPIGMGSDFTRCVLTENHPGTHVYKYPKIGSEPEPAPKSKPCTYINHGVPCVLAADHQGSHVYIHPDNRCSYMLDDGIQCSLGKAHSSPHRSPLLNKPGRLLPTE